MQKKRILFFITVFLVMFFVGQDVYTEGEEVVCSCRYDSVSDAVGCQDTFMGRFTSEDPENYTKEAIGSQFDLFGLYDCYGEEIPEAIFPFQGDSSILEQSICDNISVSVNTEDGFVYSVECSSGTTEESHELEDEWRNEVESRNSTNDYNYEEIDFTLPDASVLNQFPGATPQILVGRGIAFLVSGVMATVGLIMFIYAGLTWMLAGGNAEKSKKSLLIMFWTSLGLLAILMSYSILSFFFRAIG